MGKKKPSDTARTSRPRETFKEELANHGVTVDSSSPEYIRQLAEVWTSDFEDRIRRSPPTEKSLAILQAAAHEAGGGANSAALARAILRDLREAFGLELGLPKTPKTRVADSRDAGLHAAADVLRSEASIYEAAIKSILSRRVAIGDGISEVDKAQQGVARLDSRGSERKVPPEKPSETYNRVAHRQQSAIQDLVARLEGESTATWREALAVAKHRDVDKVATLAARETAYRVAFEKLGVNLSGLSRPQAIAKLNSWLSEQSRDSAYSSSENEVKVSVVGALQNLFRALDAELEFETKNGTRIRGNLSYDTEAKTDKVRFTIVERGKTRTGTISLPQIRIL